LCLGSNVLLSPATLILLLSHNLDVR
jgi:hypothetical protein